MNILGALVKITKMIEIFKIFINFEVNKFIIKYAGFC